MPRAIVTLFPRRVSLHASRLTVAKGTALSYTSQRSLGVAGHGAGLRADPWNLIRTVPAKGSESMSRSTSSETFGDIADCQLPIADFRTNPQLVFVRQLAIGNRQ